MENLLSIQKTFYKVADFVSWSKSKGLVLSPYFQRRAVWNKGAKSYLIDTIYKGLPIPIIFLRDRGIDKKTFEPIREVVDGQQRLRTIIAYVAPELLSGKVSADDFTVNSTHNKELANKSFKDLDESIQDRILNYEFNVHILPSSINDRDIIQIFRRMNSTNYTLKKQELLNSQYFGEFKTSQYNLAAEQLDKWRDWKTFSEDEISRMQEVELTSELSISILEKSILGKSTSRIESYYKKNDETYSERKVVEKRFRETMQFISLNFTGNKNDFVFFKKTVFYTFFMVCYDLLFGINSDLNDIKSKKIEPNVINNLKVKGDRILDRTAPSKVLDSTDRRTTNPKERTDLFDYLKNNA